MLDHILKDTIYFYDIPVGINTTPKTCSPFNQLLIRIGYRDYLSLPNGLVLFFLGKYSPGASSSLLQRADGLYLIAVKDFIVLDRPPVDAFVTIPGGLEGGSTVIETKPANLSDLTGGYWDNLILILNLYPGYSYPIDIITQVESARASLIVRNAFGIVSA